MTIKPNVSKWLSLILGVFFIVAGIGKMLDTKTFIDDVIGYGIPDKLATIGILVPTFEIILGLMLLFLIRSKDMAVISLVSLILFTLGFAYGHFVQGAEDCGCFGAIDALATPPWVSFLRNFILMAMSFLLMKNPIKSTHVPTWKWGVTVAAILISGIWSGVSSKDASSVAVENNQTNNPSTNPFVNDPMLNQKIESTALASVGSFDPDKSYLVFVFSPTCPHCWDATENVKAYKESGIVDDIYGVVSDMNQGGLPMYVERFQPNFVPKVVPQADIIRMTNAYPKIFYVRNNTIKYIMSSEIKSPWTMSQFLRGL